MGFGFIKDSASDEEYSVASSGFTDNIEEYDTVIF
jgi:hypothetical protein